MPTTVRDRPAPPIAPRTSCALGAWESGEIGPTHSPKEWRKALHDPTRPLWFVESDDGPALVRSGELGTSGDPVLAVVPAIRPEQLGDPAFRREHRLRFGYMTGAMANGIGSVEVVSAMSRVGMLGFFGAAGLSVERVTAAVARLQSSLGDSPFGCNLIHSPHEPATETAVADLYIRRGVRVVEASAFLDLTLPLIRYRLYGIRRGDNGNIETPNRIIAKVSRVEVAAKFLAPAPEKFVSELIANGDLTPAQAELARHIPVARDLTAEADSGGHTDNRPLVALLPTMIALRDRLQEQYGYAEPLRVGAAGGISTPASVAAAFSLGAAYVVTGSVNQACVESGSSDIVRRMLAEASQADVTMAPAADMFEMGVKVQVLKRGTMFAMRAARLFEVYRAYDGIDAIPATERLKLERELFRMPLDEVWRQTRDYWAGRDRNQLERAEVEPRHRLALLCRWYLGLSSRWANTGESTRQLDYQVWCGPAMGAFNEWTRGTFLEQPENRRVSTVARALMHGAAIHTRINMLKAQGIAVPPDVAHIAPSNIDEDD
jgi:trans-AT polyketide synthase, acyltransferase and oxidoreductase domains